MNIGMTRCLHPASRILILKIGFICSVYIFFVLSSLLTTVNYYRDALFQIQFNYMLIITTFHSAINKLFAGNYLLWFTSLNCLLFFP